MIFLCEGDSSLWFVGGQTPNVREYEGTDPVWFVGGQPPGIKKCAWGDRPRIKVLY